MLLLLAVVVAMKAHVLVSPYCMMRLSNEFDISNPCGEGMMTTHIEEEIAFTICRTTNSTYEDGFMKMLETIQGSSISRTTILTDFVELLVYDEYLWMLRGRGTGNIMIDEHRVYEVRFYPTREEPNLWTQLVVWSANTCCVLLLFYPLAKILWDTNTSVSEKEVFRVKVHIISIVFVCNNIARPLSPIF